ncbi:LysR substrate-binding domain-containing protein, partial [Acidisoma sp. C75]
VRAGHPLLAGPVTAEAYAACRHVVASRRGAFAGPVDTALQGLGLRRQVVSVVPGFPDALWIARATDLVALVPRSCLDARRSGTAAWPGLVGFALPVQTPPIVISAMWHPRMEADRAHRWLRETVMTVCHAAAPPR